MDDSIKKQVVALDSSERYRSDVQVPESLAAVIANYRQTVEQSLGSPTPVVESSSDYNALLHRCERLLITNPQDADTWYQHGDALANLGRHWEALQSFQRTVELASQRVDAWVFQAVMLIQLGRYQEALESAEQAIALQPEDEEAWTFRGVALRYLGRYREAYASYDQALGIQRPSFWQQLTQVSKGLLQRLGG